MVDLHETTAFTEPTTIRFQMYKKDSSRRGQSLALAQILQSLADNPHYHEFGGMLEAFSSEIKAIGSVNFEIKVFAALKAGFYDLYEICEETDLSENVVKFHLGKLIKEGKAAKRPNYALNTSEYYLTGK